MNFVENNPEQILQQSISKYNEIAQTQLSLADTETLLLSVMAYRESLLRGSMERAMRANFVQTAESTALDYWGELFGVSRLLEQSDEAYRFAILNQRKLESAGTRSAYLGKIKSIGNVADAFLVSKQDDITLPPGVIKIMTIEKQILQSGVSVGIVATQSLKDAILNVLKDTSVNLVGDVFVFGNAVPVSVNGSVQVRKNLGVSDVDFLLSVQHRVSNYFGSLSLKFNGVFGNFDLERELLQATGIRNVASLNFPNIPILRSGEFFVKGDITISIV